MTVKKAKKEKKVRRATKFICNDCGLIWELLNPTLIGRNERIYCPKCGDHFEVKVFKTTNKDGIWSDEEISWLDDYINGDIKLYTLIELTGRTSRAIAKRKHRRLWELEGDTPRLKRWTDEEKEYAIKRMNGEITMAELMAFTGRTFGGCDRFILRMKEKQNKKQGEKAK